MIGKKAEKILEKAGKLYDRSRFDEAFEHYQRVANKDSECMPAIVGMCMVFERMGKVGAIKDYFEKNKEANMSEIMLEHGKWFFKTGHYNRSMSCFNITTALDPDSYEGFFNKGVIFMEYYKDEDPDMLKKAMDCFGSALKIKPDFTNASLNMAAVLLELEKYRASIACCDEALKHNPNSAALLTKKGIGLDSMREYKKAMRCYEQALEIDPDDHIALHNKSRLHYSLDQISEFLSLLERAAKIDPDIPDYEDIKKTLTDRLKSDKI